MSSDSGGCSPIELTPPAGGPDHSPRTGSSSRQIGKGGILMQGKIVVPQSGGAWSPSRIPGVSYRALREGEARNAGTFLGRMEPGTSYPPHRHPGGEEVFIVSGSMRVGGDRLAAGDYLYTPPGGAHDADTVEGCTFLTVLPEPVEFLAEGGGKAVT